MIMMRRVAQFEPSRHHYYPFSSCLCIYSFEDTKNRFCFSSDGVAIDKIRIMIPMINFDNNRDAVDIHYDLCLIHDFGPEFSFERLEHNLP